MSVVHCFIIFRFQPNRKILLSLAPRGSGNQFRIPLHYFHIMKSLKDWRSNLYPVLFSLAHDHEMLSRGEGTGFAYWRYVRRKKSAFKIAPLQCSKKSMKFIPLHFAQIFNPFRAKNSDFLGKNALFFLDLLKFPPLQCIHQKVHPYSAFLLSWKPHPWPPHIPVGQFAVPPGLLSITFS